MGSNGHCKNIINKRLEARWRVGSRRKNWALLCRINLREENFWLESSLLSEELTLSPCISGPILTPKGRTLTLVKEVQHRLECIPFVVASLIFQYRYISFSPHQNPFVFMDYLSCLHVHLDGDFILKHYITFMLMHLYLIGWFCYDKGVCFLLCVHIYEWNYGAWMEKMTLNTLYNLTRTLNSSFFL